MNIGSSSCSESSTTSNSLVDEAPVQQMVSSNGLQPSSGGLSDDSMSSNDSNSEDGAKITTTTIIASPNGSVEIEAAVTFMTDVMKAARFEDESTDKFKQALMGLLKQYYEGHWYPNDPFKGSGYRCLRVNGVMNPLLTKAAQLSGLPIKKFRHAFPVELTVWVDPGDVSVRFGEEGSIGVYYAKSGQGLRHDHQEMEELKKLVALAPKRSATPPANLLSSSTSSCDFFSSSSSSNHRSPTLLSNVVNAHHLHQHHNHHNNHSHGGSMSNRNSPAHMLAGSPPSTSCVYNPSDMKSMSMNAANMYSTSAMLLNQSPMRKYHQTPNGMGGGPASNGHMLQHQMYNNASSGAGRRSPPEASTYNNLYQQHHPGQTHNTNINSFAGLNGQQQQGHFYGDLNRSDVNSASALQYQHHLEMVDFDASRRTPPTSFDHQFPSMAAGASSGHHRRLYEPTSAQQQQHGAAPDSSSWASSIDTFQQQHQFFGANSTNQSGGSSSFWNNQSPPNHRSSPPNPIGRFGRLREPVGVVN